MRIPLTDLLGKLIHQFRTYNHGRRLELPLNPACCHSFFVTSSWRSPPDLGGGVVPCMQHAVCTHAMVLITSEIDVLLSSHTLVVPGRHGIRRPGRTSCQVLLWMADPGVCYLAPRVWQVISPVLLAGLPYHCQGLFLSDARSCF